MSKKFYAQTDALGFPIPGTMMSASEVPAVANIIEISLEPGVTVFEKAHPAGLRFYVSVDDSGKILANSLVSAYEAADRVELGTAVSKCVTLTVSVPQGGGDFEFGLETFENELGKYVKGSINWGDESAETAVNVLDDGNTDWYLHNYAAEGTYTITVCIDKPQLIQDVEMNREGNVSITNLQDIKNWTGIDELDLSNNALTGFTLDSMNVLEELYLDDNELTAVAITNCTSLRDINLNYNTALTSVNLTGCTALENINCFNTFLTQASVTNILTAAVTSGKTGGYINLINTTGVVPNMAGQINISILKSRGWTVEVNEAPADLEYAGIPDNTVFALNTEILPIGAQTSAGTTPFTWSVSPALPTGMILNLISGDIAGTPTVATPSASYTVTATNAFGSTTKVLTFSVA